ncbi:MAG: hypothetical protein QGF18_01030 [Alphaproteobacteria bacterium]|jgi:predicted DNA-binding transcriptional regulator AlpA|nr:hypothetical protein [Alphaproteobacteria bacterium]|tara:strand:+ start:682 stop:948 length:267 start_codon:yes stop_codon:yes gene_type:complete
MGKSKLQFQPEPRLFTASQVAARLGKGETWLYEHLAQLSAQGFPKRDPLLQGWDAEAIEIWLDKRGLEPKDQDDDNVFNEWVWPDEDS